MPWKRRWYLDVKGEHKLTFRKRRSKQGKKLLHTQLPAANNQGLTDVVLQNGMLRLGHTKHSLLVAIVEDVKRDPSGRRMRVAKGFDLAIASAMCFLLYGGTAKREDTKKSARIN